jgi:hypothetical protein
MTFIGFGDVTYCSLAHRYQYFIRVCCKNHPFSFHPEDGGRFFIRNPYCYLFAIVLFNGGVSNLWDLLFGIVVRVLGYRSGGPGSIPGTTRKK